MNKIGRKIKDTRKRVGMTQTEVAGKMGVSYQTVAQWENGLRNPKPESVKRIADALGVGYLDLIPEDSKWAYLFDAATSLSALQAENEKLRAELEQKSKLITQQATELERRDTLLKEQETEAALRREQVGDAKECLC